MGQNISCDDTCPQIYGSYEITDPDAAPSYNVHDPLECGGLETMVRQVMVPPNEYGMACPQLTREKRCAQFTCFERFETTTTSTFSTTTHSMTSTTETSTKTGTGTKSTTGTTDTSTMTRTDNKASVTTTMTTQHLAAIASFGAADVGMGNVSLIIGLLVAVVSLACVLLNCNRLRGQRRNVSDIEKEMPHELPHDIESQLSCISVGLSKTFEV